MSQEELISIKVSMPDALRAQFKAACALAGTNMNEQVVKLIHTWLETKNAHCPGHEN